MHGKVDELIAFYLNVSYDMSRLQDINVDYHLSVFMTLNVEQYVVNGRLYIFYIYILAIIFHNHPLKIFQLPFEENSSYMLKPF